MGYRIKEHFYCQKKLLPESKNPVTRDMPLHHSKRWADRYSAMSHIFDIAVQHSAPLTSCYIKYICSTETQQLIRAHRHWAGREHTVCYLAAAASAWLFTGQDIAAPFSDVWDREHYNQGQHKVIAFGVVDGQCFEAEHVLIISGDSLIDSHFTRQQPATIRSLQSLCEFEGLEARTVYFDSEPYEKIQARLNLIYATTK